MAILTPYCLARKNVGSETAEEIAQDVLVSLWMLRAQLEITSIRANLFSSVRYVLIRHVKHEKVERKYEEHCRFFETAYENTPEPHRHPEILREKINALTTQLPERCHQLHLRLSENLSNTEIAQRMYISKPRSKHTSPRLSTSCVNIPKTYSKSFNSIKPLTLKRTRLMCAEKNELNFND